LVSDLFGVETDRKIVAHIREWGERDWLQRRELPIPLHIELNLPNAFNNEE
jgi:hypothetical protein